jgi:UDP-glucose 4-epimerase
LLAASHSEPLAGEIFNVGTGTMISLLALLQSMAQKKKITIDFKPPRTGDVFASCANIEKIQEHLGYDVIASTQASLVELVNPKPQ